MRRDYESMVDLTGIVHELLVKEPATRDDDNLLHCEVLSKINPILLDMPYGQVMLQRKQMGLPDVQSTSRARRKLQKKYEDLRSSQQTEDARYEDWKEMRKYATTE